MLAVTRGGPAAADVAATRVPDPVPSANEVLIRVDAAALNPFDLFLATGHAAPTDLPFSPGRDLAGTVAAGPAELVGTRVWATGGDLGTRRPGFHAEWVTLPQAAVRPIPDALTSEQAATVGVAFSTAWWALVDAGELRETRGQRVLVTGAAGAVGTAAVQLARWLGARHVWGLVRDTTEGAGVHAGADAVDTDAHRLVDTTQSQGGATLCLDTVGGPVLDQILPAMATKGRILSIATPGDGRVEFDLRRFYRTELTLRGINTGTRDIFAGAAVLQQLAAGFTSGELRPLAVAARYPLSEAAAAYQHMASRPRGKVILSTSDQMSEPPDAPQPAPEQS